MDANSPWVIKGAYIHRWFEPEGSELGDVNRRCWSTQLTDWNPFRAAPYFEPLNNREIKISKKTSMNPAKQVTGNTQTTTRLESPTKQGIYGKKGDRYEKKRCTQAKQRMNLPTNKYQAGSPTNKLPNNATRNPAKQTKHASGSSSKVKTMDTACTF